MLYSLSSECKPTRAKTATGISVHVNSATAIEPKTSKEWWLQYSKDNFNPKNSKTDQIYAIQ